MRTYKEIVKNYILILQKPYRESYKHDLNVIDCIRWNRKTGESFDGRNWSGMIEYLQDYVKK